MNKAPQEIRREIRIRKMADNGGAIEPSLDDDYEEDDEAGGGEGGLNTKKLLVMVLLPLLLIGGGAAAYLTGALDSLLNKEQVSEAEEAQIAQEAANMNAAFLKIPDMIVNLSSDSGQPRYLRLSVQLELESEEAKLAVDAAMPRVIDQFQTYLRELRVQDLRGSAGIYRLQMELLNRVNAAAYPVEVQDVLFQEILIQ